MDGRCHGFTQEKTEDQNDVKFTRSQRQTVEYKETRINFQFKKKKKKKDDANPFKIARGLRI